MLDSIVFNVIINLSQCEATLLIIAPRGSVFALHPAAPGLNPEHTIFALFHNLNDTTICY